MNLFAQKKSYKVYQDKYRYRLLQDDGVDVTSDQAESQCRRVGGHLPVFATQEEVRVFLQARGGRRVNSLIFFIQISSLFLLVTLTAGIAIFTKIRRAKYRQSYFSIGLKTRKALYKSQVFWWTFLLFLEVQPVPTYLKQKKIFISLGEVRNESLPNVWVGLTKYVIT